MVYTEAGRYWRLMVIIEDKTNAEGKQQHVITALHQLRYGTDDTPKMNYRDRLRCELEHMHGHRVGCTRQQQLRMLKLAMRFNRDTKNIHIRPYH